MLLKNLPFEVKANTGQRTFEGYASTWKKDLVGDQIVQGAFTKTIQERFRSKQPNGSDIKILWQHYDPIGLPINMYEDSKGLYVVGKISNTTLGNDALTLMSDGVVDTMSIGYDVVKEALSDDGQTNLLYELKLYEFSPVTFPANPDTSINSVKSLAYLNELNPEKLTRLLKAGRVLSESNMNRLGQAIETLMEILNSAQDPNNPTGEGKHFEPFKDTHKNLHEPFKDTQIDIKTYFDEVLQEMKNYRKERGK